jgi:hypothetical protein
MLSPVISLEVTYPITKASSNMANDQPNRSLAEEVAPTAGLKEKDFHSGETSPADTPSIRSEELVVNGYGSDHHHVFAKPEVAEYWRGVYEKAQYEGRHRFDPDITWSAEEEKKLRRKVSIFMGTATISC